MSTKFEKVAGQQIELDPGVVTTNRRIWDVASRTDPEFTKPVSYGRKFTAIDGYYQVLRATELWGPFGDGWGYDLEEETIVHGNGHSTAKVKMKLWYLDDAEERCWCGPVIATNQLYVIGEDGKVRIDDEAFKKATTDALTKTLSYLGFSADVFLGAFDDNGYVEKQKTTIAAKRQSALPEEMTAVVKQAQGLAKGTIEGGLAKLGTLFYSIVGNPKADPPIERSKVFAGLQKAQQDYVILEFKRAKATLDPAEPEQADAAD